MPVKASHKLNPALELYLPLETDICSVFVTSEQDHPINYLQAANPPHFVGKKQETLTWFYRESRPIYKPASMRHPLRIFSIAAMKWQTKDEVLMAAGWLATFAIGKTRECGS